MNANESGILYTEDNMPTESIRVEHSFDEVREKELKEYFERFGKVVSVSINRRDKQALVTFTEPQSATRALRDNMHCILGNPTKVRAGDSWSQPRKDPSQDEDQFSILNLNNDCLFHVASYLKLSDLLNMSKTCKRLEYVANVRFASYKSLDTQFFADLPFKGATEILAKIGPHVQQITCRWLKKRNKKCFRRLLKYCSNVTYLYLTGMKISVIDYENKGILPAFKNLKTLKLPDCAITDDVCAELYNCADLETLDLSENSKITGKHLDKLANLRTLNLSLVYNLRPEFLNALCMQTKLTSLNIVDCQWIDQPAIDTLANTQDKLEDLSISNNYYYADVIPLTRLKNLKRLTIYRSFHLPDEFFQELAKNRGAELEMLEIKYMDLNENVKRAFYKLKNLKELSISKCQETDSLFFTRMAESTPLEYFESYACDSVCNEGILNLIRFSATIKKINVSCCQKIAYRKLITSAVEILETKNIKEPLTLFVGENDISPDIMVDPIVLNNRHLINLKFDYNPKLLYEFLDY